MDKLNKFIKPSNKQILSHAPLERLMGDLAYFDKKIHLKFKKISSLLYKTFFKICNMLYN